MNPIDILAEYCGRGSKSFEILVDHGRQVARKALDAAVRVADLEPDLDFIEKAAMLHDIGILRTASPMFGCHGAEPYIRHGVLGRELLENIGLADAALVCERHIGVGISARDVRSHGLPLPERDMLPVSIEEQLICYADKFFSKNGNGSAPGREKPVKEVLNSLAAYGEDKVAQFKKWDRKFSRAKFIS
jgi:uncharacterized protein